MLTDILNFAVHHLVDGGRLCFWMPCANDENQVETPSHPQLKLESNCIQVFNKWSRRLLTYSRRHGDEGLAEALGLAKARESENTEGKLTADDLNAFRKQVEVLFIVPHRPQTKYCSISRGSAARRTNDRYGYEFILEYL